MQLRKATRQKAKMRAGFSAPSGFGKTFSALLVAKGLVGDWSRVAIIDTENGSADLYAHLGDYNVLPLSAPFTPEKYIEAIKACEAAGMEVIIIDSITHEWDGKGGCLEIVESLGGKYQDWAKVTPRHQAFIEAITTSPVHIFTTVRRKQDYEMSKGSDGKLKVEKGGLREITREGFEYELTLNLEFINDNHIARASKDRTGLFSRDGRLIEFVPSEETGKMLRDWCESGEDVKTITQNTFTKGLAACTTKKEVVSYYNANKATVDNDPLLQKMFKDRKAEIEGTVSDEWKESVAGCKNLDDLTQLWDGNAEVIEANPALRAFFQSTRDKMQNA